MKISNTNLKRNENKALSLDQRNHYSSENLKSEKDSISIVKKIAQAFFIGSKKNTSKLENSSNKKPYTQFNLNKNFSSLEQAAQNGDLVTTITLLRDIHENRYEHLNKAIIIASSLGHIELVRLLLCHSKADPLFDNHAALLIAAKNRQFDVIRAFIKHPKTDLSIHKNFLLKISIFYNQNDIVKNLLKSNKINPFQRSEFIFNLAIKMSKTEIIELLLDSPHARTDQAIQLIKDQANKSPMLADLIEKRHCTALSELEKTIASLINEGCTHDDAKRKVLIHPWSFKVLARFNQTERDQFLNDFVREEYAKFKRMGVS